MLISFALFVSAFGFFGPEKPQWGSGQLRYLFIYYLSIIAGKHFKARCDDDDVT